MASEQILSAAYALGTVCAWGVADFIGGYTARRFHAFLLASLGHFSGTLLVAAIALEQHEPFPPLPHLRWAILGGAAGGLSLAFFYRALSQGAMGLAAPLAAVLSAVIPAAFGVLMQIYATRQHTAADNRQKTLSFRVVHFACCRLLLYPVRA